MRAPHTARGTFVTVVVSDVRRVSRAAVAYDSCSACGWFHTAPPPALGQLA